jgi:hypothetical protein
MTPPPSHQSLPILFRWISRLHQELMQLKLQVITLGMGCWTLLIVAVQMPEIDLQPCFNYWTRLILCVVLLFVKKFFLYRKSKSHKILSTSYVSGSYCFDAWGCCTSYALILTPWLNIHLLVKITMANFLVCSASSILWPNTRFWNMSCGHRAVPGWWVASLFSLSSYLYFVFCLGGMQTSTWWKCMNYEMAFVFFPDLLFVQLINN